MPIHLELKIAHTVAGSVKSGQGCIALYKDEEDEHYALVVLDDLDEPVFIMPVPLTEVRAWMTEVLAELPKVN